MGHISLSNHSCSLHSLLVRSAMLYVDRTPAQTDLTRRWHFLFYLRNTILILSQSRTIMLGPKTSRFERATGARYSSSSTHGVKKKCRSLRINVRLDLVFERRKLRQACVFVWFTPALLSGEHVTRRERLSH